jgi:hypothetical protein
MIHPVGATLAAHAIKQMLHMIRLRRKNVAASKATKNAMEMFPSRLFKMQQQ